MSADDRRKRDRLFATPLASVKAFEFNDTVAAVFQDMISRSVPGYDLLLRMIGLYADLFAQTGSRVYDLGCSLGAASLVVAEQCGDRAITIIAVDNSAAMIERCRDYPQPAVAIEWRRQDIRDTEIENASMVVLNLTLQFLPPEQRLTLLQRIFDGLNAGGALVLSEKVEFENPDENERMRELYLGFKKTMGYSDLEISQKRNALENVLIPDTPEQHVARLQQVGFAEVYQCFRGFNFVSFLAVKA